MEHAWPAAAFIVASSAKSTTYFEYYSALVHAPSQNDMRPCTRFECARLVSEAAEKLEDADLGSSPTAKIYESLAQEFRGGESELLGGGENTQVRLESAYTRFTGISGAPLSQGYQYDFGQTVINDFGRPYEQGFNDVTGFSAWATESSFTAYVSGEFQHAPAGPPLTASARQVISQVQGVLGRAYVGVFRRMRNTRHGHSLSFSRDSRPFSVLLCK